MDGLPKYVREKRPSAFVLHRFLFVYVSESRREMSTTRSPFLFRAKLLSHSLTRFWILFRATRMSGPLSSRFYHSEIFNLLSSISKVFEIILKH